MRKTMVMILILSFAVCAAGCSSTYNMRSLAGINVRDLEQAKSSGKTQTFTAPYNETYDAVLRILEENGLTVYGESRKKRLIVAMGFKKQIDTTRVGIFFAPVSDSSTQVTLSSLSSATMEKAASIIFGGLRSSL
jgi:uncharacterized lipoprotein